MKILCVLGKHQYGDPSRGIGTEYAAFIPALKRLGHEVIHFESWDKSYFNDFKELNSSLLHVVDKEQPDILLAVQMGYEIWLETLEIIKSRGDVATICWTTDDSWKYRETSRFIGREYHAMTTTYPGVVSKYHQDGIKNVLLTKWAANAETLHEPLSAKSCRYKVTFIGAAHGDRKARIEYLRKSGVEVNCFGYGWPSGPIDAEKIPEIMQESIVSLNFAKSKGENQIKARTFEVPGAGGFLLTEDAPGLDRCYEIGKEIVTYQGMDELVKKINYYLSHPDERDCIAIAGFNRTKHEHTYDLRMKTVIEFALVSRDKWLQSRIKSRGLSFDEISKGHRLNIPLRILRSVLVKSCSLIWGNRRGPRAARRILFELGWRLSGKKVYTAAGWPGRMFYNES